MDLEAKAGTVDECLDFIDETTGASRKKWGDFGENEDYLKFFEKIVLLFGTLSTTRWLVPSTTVHLPQLPSSLSTWLPTRTVNGSWTSKKDMRRIR